MESMVIVDNVYGGHGVLPCDDEANNLLDDRHHHQHYKSRTQEQFEFVLHGVTRQWRNHDIRNWII